MPNADIVGWVYQPVGRWISPNVGDPMSFADRSPILLKMPEEITEFESTPLKHREKVGWIAVTGER